jgi:DNA-binding NtrC family response regulator
MKKLLIVDDDCSLVESLRVVFNGLYQVYTAFSAEQAADILQQESVDVILLDVILPEIDGIDFLKTIHQSYPNLPVVMISGAPSIRPVIRALDLGAADYVRKPFDIDELRLVVARSLEISKLREQLKNLKVELSRRLPQPKLGGKPLKQVIEDLERQFIKCALEQADGVQTRAAETLGITRRVLRYRIGKLDIKS